MGFGGRIWEGDVAGKGLKVVEGEGKGVFENGKDGGYEITSGVRAFIKENELARGK